jgi:hypothetical protein
VVGITVANGENTMLVGVKPITVINEICIAPLNKRDIAKKGMVEFLKNNGFENPSKLVAVSDIKLRY